jgi:hypothetical protein
METQDYVNKIYEIIESSINDTELQDRYDVFCRDYEKFRKQFNDSKARLDEHLGSRQRIINVITQSAILGFINNDAISSLKNVDEVISDISDVIDHCEKSMKYNMNLMDKYRNLSESKFFCYWRVLKTLDENTKSWVEWYSHSSYKNRII